MSWKFFLYDWGGLNIALFQAINMSTPAALEPLASFFNLVIGNYWTAPLMLLARHCCKVSDEAAFCLIQRPYISKTLLTRRISPRGSP
ncbi:Broad mercury transporter MerE [Leclercia adecarboxylata]